MKDKTISLTGEDMCNWNPLFEGSRSYETDCGVNYFIEEKCDDPFVCPNCQRAAKLQSEPSGVKGDFAITTNKACIVCDAETDGSVLCSDCLERAIEKEESREKERQQRVLDGTWR